MIKFFKINYYRKPQAEGGFIGGRVIFSPPGFFFPDLRERVGFPGFPPMPGLVTLGLRDKLGLLGVSVGSSGADGAGGAGATGGSGGKSREGAGGVAMGAGSSAISSPIFSETSSCKSYYSYSPIV